MSDQILIGILTAFTFANLLYCFIGVLVGNAVGVLPGIGSLAAITMLLPFTFYLEPTAAIIMLAGVYYGAEYGGATTSILLNLPGGAANAVTCLDGYPMAQKGRAGVALFVTTFASFIGGSLGILLLMVATPMFLAFSMKFQSREFFVAILLGLLLAATITRGSPLKGLAMLAIGILLGLVGADVQTGLARFTGGEIQLYDGVSVVILAMALFGVAEIIWSVTEDGTPKLREKITMRSLMPTRDDVKRSVAPTLRGTAVGSIVGPLPGAGMAIATFLSYAIEKRISRRPHLFGTGIVEGIAAPEAANNAAAQTSFIPTFALGIPGSTTTAIIMGAMMMHGIVPGPQFMRENLDMFWAIVASFWVGNVLLLILNIPFIGVWVRLLKIPYPLLFPAITCFVCLGAYTLQYNTFDMWMLFVFGIAGLVLRLLEFEVAPMLMGFVLGPMLEENFRRAMLLSGGNVLEILGGPVNLTMLGLFAATAIWSTLRRARTAPPVAEPAD